MRSIKLRDIVGASVLDADILRALAPDIGLPTGILNKMLLSYLSYRAKRGSNALPALGIGAPWPDTFSALYQSRTQANGLDWIDKIASTTRYGYCPMCGSETHKTVEHFLPRSPWAEFSFFSLNLVPSCGTCNNKRGNRANSPTSAVRPLHPYYDHKLLDRRLYRTKISPPFAAPKFEYEVCAAVGAKSRSRVDHHLKHSVDPVEYQQFCVNRWSEARLEVRRCATLAKWKKTLQERLQDAEATGGINSWRSAFYSGLLARKDAVRWLYQFKHSP